MTCHENLCACPECALLAIPIFGNWKLEVTVFQLITDFYLTPSLPYFLSHTLSSLLSLSHPLFPTFTYPFLPPPFLSISIPPSSFYSTLSHHFLSFFLLLLSFAFPSSLPPSLHPSLGVSCNHTAYAANKE